MYFITKKDSETGKKFQKLEKKRDIAIAETKTFAEKYNIKQWRGAYLQVWGGMSSCIFEEKPDTKIWGKGAEYGEYFPKKNSKIAKAVWEELDNVTCVGIDELNSCVRLDEPFNKMGFASGNSEFFGFEIGEDWEFTKPKDCKEIITSKYNEMFK